MHHTVQSAQSHDGGTELPPDPDARLENERELIRTEEAVPSVVHPSDPSGYRSGELVLIHRLKMDTEVITFSVF